MPIVIPDGDRLELISTSFIDRVRNGDARDIASEIIAQDDCECISDDLVAELSNRISQKFQNAPATFVGSSKLGFSLKQLQADGTIRGFDIGSDIDIAICDSALFDAFWVDTYDFFCTKQFWGDIRGYQKYFFRGWIRPDKLPHKIEQRNDWFDFFRDLSRDCLDSAYDIRAALYKSGHFLHTYQTVALSRIQSNLELGR